MVLVKNHLETGVLAEEPTDIVATVFMGFQAPLSLYYLLPIIRGPGHTQHKADTKVNLFFLY